MSGNTVVFEAKVSGPDGVQTFRAEKEFVDGIDARLWQGRIARRLATPVEEVRVENPSEFHLRLGEQAREAGEALRGNQRINE